MWPVDKNVPWDRVQNASLNVQRSIGGGTVVDVGYTGNWAYNQNLTANINPIPIGTRAPFNPKNADPTNGNQHPARHLPAHRLSRLSTASTTTC